MQHTIPTSSVQRWFRLAADLGLERSELFERTGINADVLDAGGGRATLEQFDQLIRAIREARDDDLLQRSTHEVRRGTCALLARFVMGGRDLGAAIERAQQFVAVIPGLPDVDVEIGPDRTRVCLDTSCLVDPNHILNDGILSIVHRFGSWLTGKRIPLTAVEMPYEKPAGPSEFELIFRCQPTYGHEQAALEFDSRLLRSPNVRSEDDLEDLLAASPLPLLVLVDYESTMGEQVRRLVGAGLHGTWPTAEEVAADLAISPQHLRRKLLDEQTSFTRIREEVQRDAAVASLTTGRESTTELSRRLGFSEESAFRRAFRRWTGSPPGAYRRGDWVE